MGASRIAPSVAFAALCICISILCCTASTHVASRRHQVQGLLEHTRAATRTHYTHSNSALVDQLGHSITPTSQPLYNLFPNTSLYYATTDKFSQIDQSQPLILSPDRLEVWKKTMYESATSTTPKSVSLLEFRTLKPLRLWLMRRTEFQSKSELLSLRDSTGKLVWQVTNAQFQTILDATGKPVPFSTSTPAQSLNHPNVHWYGVSSSDPIYQQFTQAFCTIMSAGTTNNGGLAYDGWRNPWQHDEVVLCPTNPSGPTYNVPVVIAGGSSLKSKLGIVVSAAFCPYARWSPLFSARSAAASSSASYNLASDTAYKGVPIIETLPTVAQRYHHFILNKLTASVLPSPPATPNMDQLRAIDTMFANQLLLAACCRWDEPWKAMMTPLSESKPFIPAASQSTLQQHQLQPIALIPPAASPPPPSSTPSPPVPLQSVLKDTNAQVQKGINSQTSVQKIEVVQKIDWDLEASRMCVLV